MSQSRLETSLSEIEALIQRAEFARAREILHKIVKRKVPRELTIRVAALCRRADLALEGLRVLNPIVRPSPRSSLRPTPAEAIEYAGGLTKVGANLEALALLEKFKDDEYPVAFLFESFALVNEWRYQESIPLLQTFIAHESISEYQRLVGNLNLAAALVFLGRLSEVENCLKLVRTRAAEQSYLLLLGNALELSAQCAVLERRWSDSETYLKAAEKTLRNTAGLYRLFIEKWIAVARLMREGPNQATLEGLEKVREAARRQNHWETVRDCDLHEAHATRNLQLTQHIYHGTPFEAFRERISREWKGNFSPLPSYRWELRSGKGQQWKLSPAGLVKDRVALKMPRTLFVLLRTFTSDFYQPFSVARLHQLVYPGEYFNPDSSPTKIHQLVKRFRQWLARQNIALSVVAKEGDYRIEPAGSIAIEISGHPSASSTITPELAMLEARFGARPFSAQEASQILPASPRTTCRILAGGAQRGLLARSGSARATRYRFVTAPFAVTRKAS